MTNPVPWQDSAEHHYRNCEEQALVVAEAERSHFGGERQQAGYGNDTEAYLKKKISNGLCRQLPFQLLYILCLLAYPHDVHTHSKTCQSWYKEYMSFLYYYIETSYGKHRPFLTHHLLAPVALTLAKLLLIYICVKISPVCSRKYSAQLGQFRHMK